MQQVLQFRFGTRVSECQANSLVDITRISISFLLMSIPFPIENESSTKHTMRNSNRQLRQARVGNNACVENKISFVLLSSKDPFFSPRAKPAATWREETQ